MKISDAISLRNVGDELFVYDRKNALIHTINSTGKLIWDMLGQELTQEKILAHITDKFDVNPTEAKDNLNVFVKELKEKKIIQ